MNRLLDLKIPFLILIVLLILDQITKMAMVNNFALHESVSITSFFNLTLVHNQGAAFGFLSDQPGWQRWFFTLISSLAVIFISVWIFKLEAKNKILLWALVFILVGAIGNLMDRIIFGYVIDFLDFFYQAYHWPAFNIADSSIFIGIVLFILDSVQEVKGK
jgi:signal peptidase II